MNKLIIKNIFPLVALAWLAACNTASNNQLPVTDTVVVDSAEIERNIEAREDSLKMAEALALKAKYTNSIQADYETKAVQSLEGEDAADDPAIWVNRKNPEKSLIIGTNKKAGLYVYDLQGNELQFVNVGFINNADVRYDFVLGKEKFDIVAGSNRTDNSVVIMKIDADSMKISEKPIGIIQSKTDEVYGICLYHNPKTKKHYVFVNGKGGKIEQWLLTNSGLEMKSELVRSFSVNSQPEGMVADDQKGILYVGVEEEGIFRFYAEPTADTTAAKISMSDMSNPDIHYDIEGLAIYRTSKTEGYLLASSQGSFSYAVFDLSENNNYITSFVIGDGTVDGVEETDGIEITSTPLGKQFAKGIFVAQDGFNKEGETDVNQNFKIVSCEKIIGLFKK